MSDVGSMQAHKTATIAKLQWNVTWNQKVAHIKSQRYVCSSRAQCTLISSWREHALYYLQMQFAHSDEWQVLPFDFLFEHVYMMARLEPYNSMHKMA